jgi:hypothetical protein
MAKTTQTANPFGNLTHSAYVPTYVGLPIERMKETADVLQDKYNTAVANDNTTKTQLAQMALNEVDEKKRIDALAGYEEAMKGIRESGRYEDANTIISNSAADIATNSGLIESLKSEQGRIKQKALQDQQLAAGKAQEKDIDYVNKVAKENYAATGGVYFDEETGAWTGKWEAPSIPEVQNIGAVADKFLAGWKADTKLGKYIKVKDKDGEGYKWYDTTGHVDDTGLFIVSPSVEEAKIEDVMYAAQKHLLQDPAVSNRLDFEMGRDNVTFQSIVDASGEEANIRRILMQNDLVNLLGYDEKTILQLDDEELALLHEKNKRIQEGILGAGEKHSYEKTTQKKLGDSLYARKMKAAAEAGSDEAAVEIEHQNSRAMSGAQKTGGLNWTVSEYVETISSYDNVIKAQEQTVTNLRNQIQAALKQNASTDVGGLKNSLAKAQMLLDEQKEKKRIDNINWNIAKTAAEKELGIDDSQEYVEKVRELETENPKEKKYYDDLKNKVRYVWQYNQKRQNLPFDNTEWEKAQDKYWGAKWWASSNSFQDYAFAMMDGKRSEGGTWIGTGAPGNWIWSNTPEQQVAQDTWDEVLKESKQLKLDHLQNAKDWGGAESPKQKYWRNTNELQAANQDIGEEITRQLGILNAPKQMQYSYIDMSKSRGDKSASSVFQKTANSALMNSPHNYRVIDKQTGKEIAWHLNNDAGGSNISLADGTANRNNINILGITTQYMNNFGYGFAAQENIMSEDGKEIIGTRDLMIVEKTGNSVMLDAAKVELQKGFVIESIGDNKGVQKGMKEMGWDKSDAYFAKLNSIEIDRQLAQMDEILPPIPSAGQTTPNSQSMNVIVSLDKRAEVTMNRYPNGTYDYDISVWEINSAGKKGKKVTPDYYKRKENKGYQNRHEVELVLERFAGIQNYYEEPLSTMEKVANGDLPGAKLTNNMTSTNHLNPAFKQDLYSWLKTHNKAFDPDGEGFNVASMTRDKGYNLAIGGSRTAGQLTGKGIDITIDTNGSVAMSKWLGEIDKKTNKGKNTEEYKIDPNYKRIKGTNLIFRFYSIDDANGSRVPHLDLQYAKQ